jgi:hypothetical protein
VNRGNRAVKILDSRFPTPYIYGKRGIEELKWENGNSLPPLRGRELTTPTGRREEIP